MRAKKLLKRVGIVAVVLLAILLLFIVAFVFNPFEGRLRDMRDAVPRSVDFFLRKEHLADDFIAVPVPHFWPVFENSVAWERVRQGPAFTALERDVGISKLLADVRYQVEDIARQTPIDPMRDLLGTEVQIAGTLRNPLASTTWCLYARVSWRIRAAFGLARYGFVQDIVRNQGIELTVDGDILGLQSARLPAPLWAARELDCVMVSNDRDMLERSLALARGTSDADTLGTSSDYRDGVEARLHDWEQARGFPANALEFYLRPEQLFPITRFDDNWPDANHPDSMNERVLAAFVNLSGWRFLSGALTFEPNGLGMLARVMLNQNEHTPFQAEFFRTEAQRRQEWLDPFLAMAPESCFGLAAMRMPAGPFLRQMYRAVDKTWRELCEEQIRKTGVYKSMDDLLGQLELALLPRVGFVFGRNVRREGDPPVDDPVPLPHVAWVFWLRDAGGREVAQKLVKALLDNSWTIFMAQTYNYEILNRPEKVLEFTNRKIPGTGTLAFLVYDQFFFVSNSASLISNMIATRDGRVRGVLARPEMRSFLEDLPNAVNGFLYVQGPELEQVFVDVDKYVQDAARGMDNEWALNNRSQVESKVFQENYRRYGSMAGMPVDVREAFNREVDAALERLWAADRTNYTADDRATLQQGIGIARTFSAAYLQLVLDPQSIQLQGRAQLDFR